MIQQADPPPSTAAPEEEFDQVPDDLKDFGKVSALRRHLDRLVESPDIAEALIGGSDGMKRITNTNLARDRADKLTAICTTMFSLGQKFDCGPTTEVGIAMEQARASIVPCGQYSFLAVVTSSPDADMRAVISEVTTMANRIRKHADPRLRGAA